MLGHNPYNHDIIKKATIIFGGLFNDIEINRTANNGSVEQVVKVPINYGPADKTLLKNRQEPDLTPAFAITLPRMAFELMDIGYNPDRQLMPMGQILAGNNLIYNPVPYDLTFDLAIMVNQMVDGTRILEQILPFFRPSYNVPARLLGGSDCSENIPITLLGVTRQDDYQGTFDERRTHIWRLSFSMQVNFYGPTTDASDKIIKHIELQFHTTTDVSSNTYTSTTIQPGLTANGMPTTNVAQSIPWIDIQPTDNWAFIVDLES